MKARFLVALGGLALALSLPLGASSDPPEPVVKARLSDLSFLTGSWRGESKEAVVEETWSAPVAGSVMGMFRWTAGEKVVLYEFFVLTEKGEGDGVEFRLRHFDAALAGREEKDAPLVYRTVSVVPGEEVVFEHVEDEKTATKILYRKNGDAGLHSTVEMKRDGSTTTIRFDFTRS